MSPAGAMNPTQERVRPVLSGWLMLPVVVALYIAMGWLVVIALKPLVTLVDHGLIMWLVIGGLSYTLGVIFYAAKRMPYHHPIWHLFVLGGSICQYLGILFHLSGV